MLLNKIIFIKLILNHVIALSHMFSMFDWLPNKKTICSVVETCGNCIAPDLNNLTATFDQHVFGQHIATQIVTSALRDHLSQQKPMKPLTMAFLGWPGIGKNYVTSFIVNNLYVNAFDSNYVKFYAGQIAFPEAGRTDYYKEFLYNDIIKTVKNCPKSIFIFDEIDKIPIGMLDALKPIFDFDSYLGHEFRYTIFIFLSNAGGSVIAKKLNDFLSAGYKREDTQLYDFEHDIKVDVFNEHGGLKKSEIIAVDLIDHYIPFLPLEDKHVELCILKEFSQLNISPTAENINEIKKYITFDSSNRFATSGCKRIHKKCGALKYMSKDEL